MTMGEVGWGLRHGTSTWILTNPGGHMYVQGERVGDCCGEAPASSAVCASSAPSNVGNLPADAPTLNDDIEFSSVLVPSQPPPARPAVVLELADRKFSEAEATTTPFVPLPEEDRVTTVPLVPADFDSKRTASFDSSELETLVNASRVAMRPPPLPAPVPPAIVAKQAPIIIVVPKRVTASAPRESLPFPLRVPHRHRSLWLIPFAAAALAAALLAPRDSPGKSDVAAKALVERVPSEKPRVAIHADLSANATANAPLVAADPAPPSNEALLRRADVAARTGDLKQATTLYQQVLASDPTNSEALCGVADQGLADSDFDKASDGYRRALTANPSYLAAWVGLGDTQWISGDKIAAETTYRDIVSRFAPDLVPPYIRRRAAESVP